MPATLDHPITGTIQPAAERLLAQLTRADARFRYGTLEEALAHLGLGPEDGLQVRYLLTCLYDAGYIRVSDPVIDPLCVYIVP